VKKLVLRWLGGKAASAPACRRSPVLKPAKTNLSSRGRSRSKGALIQSVVLQNYTRARRLLFANFCLQLVLFNISCEPFQQPLNAFSTY
jgi:hypothetical protein